ncbi:MAG: Mth938-like domain-containing protein [Proteobacteria bacterium]|nr:Mth938-like domain-containing protein [Pseudomonadota bacterium]MDA0981734.1 Mth938-like domain-containing protein [Pseudomonadota bacterium]
MKLHAHAPSARNTFTAYGEGWFAVNGERHESSLIVFPDCLIDWPVARFDALRAEDFASLAEAKPEIVLLGTGTRQRFPHPRLTQALMQARVGVEVMDTAAACRTYNILMAEERRVAAALLVA